MKRIAIWALVFFITTNVADQARSADDRITALENCFKATRLADAICSNPGNSPQQRFDCFRKTQAAQLTCIEHAASGDTGSVMPAETPAIGSLQAPQPETAGPPLQAPVQAVPPTIATAAPEDAPAATTTAPPPVINPPNVPEKIAAVPARQPQQPSLTSTPPNAVAPVRLAPTMRPKTPDKSAGPPAKPANLDWTVSDTSSPVDYSPVVVATIKSSTSGKDAPNAFSIQCRQRRTEIALRTDGVWRVAPNGKILVAFQTRDNSATSPWNLSANGKVATNADNAVDLIQTLSESTALAVVVSDGADHAATFRLTGLDAVRKKIFAACRSTTPLTESKASFVKH